MNKLKKINCPACGKAETWRQGNPFRPFCSERCKLIDLGAWASEDHKIPTDEHQGNIDESFSEQQDEQKH